MSAKDMGKRDIFNFEGEVRSSAELLRRFQIKREKVLGNNIKKNKPPTTAAVTSKPKGFDNHIRERNQEAANMQSKRAQIKDPMKLSTETANMQSKRTQIQDPKKLPTEAAKIQGKRTQIENPKKLPIEVTNKRKLVEHVGSHGRQPTKRAIAESNELQENETTKRSVAEHSGSHERQPMKMFLQENVEFGQEEKEGDASENEEDMQEYGHEEENALEEGDGEINGTMARNPNFCPLIYTNFKGLTKDERERIWDFVNEKFIIPEKGKKAIFAHINDAWRRYKNYIKRNYFLKYSTLRERLKHRPKHIPKNQYRHLMVYWRNSIVQNISQKNAINMAKQKYIHRMGPTNFARIRAKLQEKKNGDDVSQAEMFIETRQSRKGKEVDKDTQIVITKLQESIQSSSSESVEQAFQSIFGKEKPGRVRCLGRTITPSMLKKNEEIVALKKQHSIEIGSMAKTVQGLQGLIRCLLKEINPELDDQALDSIVENAISNENSVAPPSSASTHIPGHDKERRDDEDQPYDNEEAAE
ncbi:putative transposase, Ptta/En/Spm, plant [Sesbania bispinosa]|nr:putative transposase, Ptta/En/Spm, plant [Sesbania bispinosa]